MNVRDYEYIIEISLCGGLTKAAENLGITPGALSKYLARIEDELQLKLFTREGNSLSLTSFGKRYIEIGREILALDKLLMNDVKNVREGGKTSLRIGIPRGMTDFVMQSVFPVFLKKYPRESLFLERGGSHDMSELVISGKLDAAMVFAEEQDPALKYRKLCAMEAVLAVPMDSPLISRTQKVPGSRYRLLKTEDWLEEPYIETTHVSIQGIMADRYFERIGRQPQTRLCVGDSVTALAAVENGLGNCIVLASPAQERMVQFLKVEGMDLSLDFYAVTRKKDY